MTDNDENLPIVSHVESTETVSESRNVLRSDSTQNEILVTIIITLGIASYYLQYSTV